ncbi:MAG: DUF1737 domain-containing protein [Pseudomonadota bacterium]
MIGYRFLSADDTDDFCHKVSEALSNGWQLYGEPVYALDAARGVMRCGQAVTKEIDGDYSRDRRLSEL